MPDYFEELKEFATKASSGLEPASDFESEYLYGFPWTEGVEPSKGYSIGPLGEDALAQIRALQEYRAYPGAFSSVHTWEGEDFDPEELEALRRKVANYAEKYRKFDPKDVARLAELEALESSARQQKRHMERRVDQRETEEYERGQPDERWVSIEKAAPRLRRMADREPREPMEPYERVSPMVRPGVDAFESLMDSLGFSATEIPEGTRVVERSVERVGAPQFYEGDDYDPREDILSASMPKRY